MSTRSASRSSPRNVGRRRVLAGGLAAGVAGVSASSARAEKTRAWRMVTSWPKDAPGPGSTARRIAERITAMSDGALTVKLFAAGELVPAFEVFEAVAGNVAEMGHSASFFWAGKLPASPFYTAVPFGLTPDGHNAWLYHGGGQGLWDELYAPHGVKPFAAGNSGLQMGGWYKREIASLDDFAGRKLRMPGLGGAVARRLGAVAVSLPPGEIYPALASGAIDGAEFLGPWSDRALGLSKAAPFYYWPGFHEPNGSAEALVNREAFAALPADLQAIVAAACEAENARGMAEADWHNAQALAALEAEGVKLRRFPDDLLAAARVASDDVLSDLAARDPMARRIWDSYRVARGAAVAWGRVSRHAVLDSQLRA